MDGDGVGRTVILNLEEQGIPVQSIRWGSPCFATAAQRRYANMRAYAHCQLRDAIFQRRFRGPRLKNFVEQASQLPYKLDERGRYAMETKERMRTKGIKSPDICDTCCFAFLAEYTPVVEGRKQSGKMNEMAALAKVWLAKK